MRNAVQIVEATSLRVGPASRAWIRLFTRGLWKVNPPRTFPFLCNLRKFSHKDTFSLPNSSQPISTLSPPHHIYSTTVTSINCCRVSNPWSHSWFNPSSSLLRVQSVLCAATFSSLCKVSSRKVSHCSNPCSKHLLSRSILSHLPVINERCSFPSLMLILLLCKYVVSSNNRVSSTTLTTCPPLHEQAFIGTRANFSISRSENLSRTRHTQPSFECQKQGPWLSNHWNQREWTCWVYHLTSIISHIPPMMTKHETF